MLRTVLYADVFNFALSPREIHHFLITDETQSAEAVNAVIDALCAPGGPLIARDGFVCLADRPTLIELRQTREASSAALMPAAVTYGGWLAAVPFIRMVAITGALAVRNAAGPDDDLDYLLVTAPGRVWLARAFSIVLVRLARRRGHVICPNYVLAETALAQARQDLFVAHELAQMLAVYGAPVAERMRAENLWTQQLLANAAQPLHALSNSPPGRAAQAFKRAAEWTLAGRLGDALERWEQQRKLRRFAEEMQTANHAALLDGEHVKGHFNDHGHRVLQAYAERVARYSCADAPAAD